MKCKEIIEIIEKRYPLDAAESWDNPGLIAGDDEDDISKIMVALDATDETIDQAVKEKAQLLITHHPMIFGKIRQVNNKTLEGRRLLKLIKNGISCYAMHTNFDVKSMADINEAQIGLNDTEVLYPTAQNDNVPEGIGRVGWLEKPMKYDELAMHVKRAMHTESVRCYGNTDRLIKRAAVSGGSGKSMIQAALDKHAEVLITGDIDYHTGIDACANGLLIIDAGHFGTEHVFKSFMTKWLKEVIPGCDVIEACQNEPFFII